MAFSELFAYQPLAAIGLALLAFGLGACAGSFIYTIARRMAAGENIRGQRNHCVSCGHTLSARDLIPVVSWLALWGTCRYCGERFSRRYLVTELLEGAFFLSMVLAFGLSWETLLYCILGTLLLGVSYVDLDTFTIPNGFIIAGFAAWVLYILVVILVDGTAVAFYLVKDGLLGCLCIAGTLLLVSLLMENILKRQAVGGGDIKLIAMLSLVLGFRFSLINVLLACIIGAISSFIHLHQGREIPVTAGEDSEDPQDGEMRKGPLSRAFPFGPAIAIASWATLLLGAHILMLYVQLFL